MIRSLVLKAGFALVTTLVLSACVDRPVSVAEAPSFQVGSIGKERKDQICAARFIRQYGAAPQSISIGSRTPSLRGNSVVLVQSGPNAVDCEITDSGVIISFVDLT